MGNFLTEKQRLELRLIHRAEDKRRYADRIKALLAWDSGWRLEDISALLLLDEKTIETSNPASEVIYAIADNASYYRNKRVKEYLATSKIKMIFLPPYAPNLNLIERLWKFFKKKVIYNRYYATFEEFRKACTDFFVRLNSKDFQKALDSLLAGNFQILQA